MPCVTIAAMVTHDEKQAFSNRLNESLDRIGFPAKGKGRQVALAKMFHVTQKGARKWLEGEAIPATARLGEIAQRVGVSVEWLLTGRGRSTPGIDYVAEAPPGDYQTTAIIGSESEGPGRGLREVAQRNIAICSADPKAYALVVTDNSLSNRALPGEALLVEPRRKAVPGDEVVCALHSGWLGARVLEGFRGEEVFLRTLGYGERRVVQLSEIAYLHVVVAVFRPAAIAIEKL